MVPSVDNTKVATAIGLLTSSYAGKPVITGILTSLANRFQLLEQQTWSVINAYILSNYPIAGQDFSVALDNIGAIIGEPRGGRNDEAYVPALYLRILVNRSDGSTMSLIGIVQKALANAGVTPTLFTYWEPTPGEFEFDIVSLPTALLNALSAVLPLARPAGYSGMIVSSSAPVANVITWGSVGFGGTNSFASNRSI